MTENPTTGEPSKAKPLTEDDAGAAVCTFMADSGQTALLYSNGPTLHRAEALKAQEWTSVAVGNKEATQHL